MKNFLLLIPFFLTSIFLFGQDYQPFLEGNPAWKVYGIDNGLPSDDTTTDVEYTLQGDTIIEGINYTTLNIERAPSSYFYPFIDEAYLREDIETRQVFIRFKDDDQELFGGNEELLLYDFGLTEGDSFFLYEDFDGNEVTIISDTTYTIDGESRAAWITDFPQASNSHERIYVEGIGFLSDLLIPVLYQELTFYAAYTYCYSNTVENVIHDFDYLSVPESFDCNATVNTENTESELRLTIYPNPSSEKVKVQLSGLEEVLVSDLVGKLVYQNSNIKSDQVELDNSKLLEGIYLLKACTQNRKCAMKRMVVKH